MEVRNRSSGEVMFVWPGETLAQAWLVRAELPSAHLVAVDLTGADMTGANLTGADLRCAHLVAARLPRAILRDADLSGADLTKADLSGASFANARLTGCSMRGALMVDAVGTSDFVGADLTGADLSLAHIRSVDLHGAVLTNIDLTGAAVWDDTRWPEGFSPAAHGAASRPSLRIDATPAADADTAVRRLLSRLSECRAICLEASAAQRSRDRSGGSSMRLPQPTPISASSTTVGTREDAQRLLLAQAHWLAAQARTRPSWSSAAPESLRDVMALIEQAIGAAESWRQQHNAASE